MTLPHEPVIYPLTSERWADLEALFGSHGAYGGCWCMYYRLPQSQFVAQSGEGNRLALKALVDTGTVPGLIAYVDGNPAGWVSLAPRADFSRLSRSKVLKAVDDQPVWSVVCFYVAKAYRRQGLMVALLKAAVAYAGEHGATIVEGYPIDPGEGKYPDASAFNGLFSAYRTAGFEEVARRSDRRPIMRIEIKDVD
jgi:GNAT superfamily N-acetyltransferase